jgi:hypothetical protein
MRNSTLWTKMMSKFWSNHIRRSRRRMIATFTARKRCTRYRMRKQILHRKETDPAIKHGMMPKKCCQVKRASWILREIS